jgi:hypothetical protein
VRNDELTRPRRDDLKLLAIDPLDGVMPGVPGLRVGAQWRRGSAGCACGVKKCGHRDRSSSWRSLEKRFYGLMSHAHRRWCPNDFEVMGHIEAQCLNATDVGQLSMLTRKIPEPSWLKASNIRCPTTGEIVRIGQSPTATQRVRTLPNVFRILVVIWYAFVLGTGGVLMSKAQWAAELTISKKGVWRYMTLLEAAGLVRITQTFQAPTPDDKGRREWVHLIRIGHRLEKLAALAAFETAGVKAPKGSLNRNQAKQLAAALREARRDDVFAGEGRAYQLDDAAKQATEQRPQGERRSIGRRPFDRDAYSTRRPLLSRDSRTNSPSTPPLKSGLSSGLAPSPGLAPQEPRVKRPSLRSGAVVRHKTETTSARTEAQPPREDTLDCPKAVEIPPTAGSDSASQAAAEAEREPQLVQAKPAGVGQPERKPVSVAPAAPAEPAIAAWLADYTPPPPAARARRRKRTSVAPAEPPKPGEIFAQLEVDLGRQLDDEDRRVVARVLALGCDYTHALIACRGRQTGPERCHFCGGDGSSSTVRGGERIACGPCHGDGLHDAERVLAFERDGEARRERRQRAAWAERQRRESAKGSAAVELPQSTGPRAGKAGYRRAGAIKPGDPEPGDTDT